MMNQLTARRFPLVARPRPACTPLPERIKGLQRIAASAVASGHLTTAVSVFNLAALLASDVGLHETARQWCHRLATLAQRHPGPHALEPVVNLARLRIRAGDGPAAWTMLENLYQAVTIRSDITIDGIDIRTAELTLTPDAYHDLRQWLWKVLLGTGSHALASVGHWDEARHRLTRHRAIGQRMFDGRQIAVIAHTLAGEHLQAHELLRTTERGEAWENAVTNCLTLLCRRKPFADTSVFADLSNIEPGLAVFWTRLGLSLVDAADAGPNDPHPLANRLLQIASKDGYAARDVLDHAVCRASATKDQLAGLHGLVDACGLGRGHLSSHTQRQLTDLLDQVEPVVRGPAHMR